MQINPKFILITVLALLPALVGAWCIAGLSDIELLENIQAGAPLELIPEKRGKSAALRLQELIYWVGGAKWLAIIIVSGVGFRIRRNKNLSILNPVLVLLIGMIFTIFIPAGYYILASDVLAIPKHLDWTGSLGINRLCAGIVCLSICFVLLIGANRFTKNPNEEFQTDVLDHLTGANSD